MGVLGLEPSWTIERVLQAEHSTFKVNLLVIAGFNIIPIFVKSNQNLSNYRNVVQSSPRNLCHSRRRWKSLHFPSSSKRGTADSKCQLGECLASQQPSRSWLQWLQFLVLSAPRPSSHSGMPTQSSQSQGDQPSVHTLLPGSNRQPDNALLHCPYNNGIGFWLIRCLREITPTLQPAQLIMLNFGVDQHQKNALPAAWLTAKTQQAVWTTRVAKKNTTIGITRATLKANIMFCNNFAWTNDLPDKCHPDNCPHWQFSKSF